MIILVTHLENVDKSDKETQIDHISMLKEYDLIRYQQQHPDIYRPYGKFLINFCFRNIFSIVEMQRIRKDSETLSTTGYNTIPRGRSESDRIRADSLSAAEHRNIPNQPIIREVIKNKMNSFFF